MLARSVQLQLFTGANQGLSPCGAQEPLPSAGSWGCRDASTMSSVFGWPSTPADPTAYLGYRHGRKGGFREENVVSPRRASHGVRHPQSASARRVPRRAARNRLMFQWTRCKTKQQADGANLGPWGGAASLGRQPGPPEEQPSHCYRHVCRAALGGRFPGRPRDSRPVGPPPPGADDPISPRQTPQARFCNNLKQRPQQNPAAKTSDTDPRT